MCTTLSLFDAAATVWTGTGCLRKCLLGFSLSSLCPFGVLSVFEFLTFFVAVYSVVLQAVDFVALMAFEAVLVGV